MKKFTMFLTSVFFLLLSCSNSNAGKETAKEEIAAVTNSNNEALSAATPADVIVGDWKLTLETYDNNHNKTLDDEERKKGFANHYFYRFSANGSCLISPFANNQVQSAFKGHYVITEKNGRKIITTYWDEAEQKGQQESQYTIVSVNKDELVLLETTGDHTFWIFKRIG